VVLLLLGSALAVVVAVLAVVLLEPEPEKALGLLVVGTDEVLLELSALGLALIEPLELVLSVLEGAALVLGLDVVESVLALAVVVESLLMLDGGELVCEVRVASLL
jgi:hypothetical protein